ncbi:hypothetical protein TH61_01295 [Rufibacter sp. DG15C]|uniref:GSCFA domain-containing protein n=1 Tax=Rufibacter sp. DG15C TaxID=1379909 RepID=UPI00078B6781|nr:GSCFA domain-containing protein [Rufibacter sp. DG15C]AMM50081.1 hypothetical protein TH61_01295 [Rufibacter sp. DG15C]
MQFRTELSVSQSPTPISLGHGILTLGSCFAEVIGQRLLGHKAKVLVNPFGTIFNPLSAHSLLRRIITQNVEGLQGGLLERQGQWFHYDFHSSFTSSQPEALLQLLEKAISDAHAFLQDTQHLLLTWGTAFVYERQDTGQSVSNCHKVPQKQFNKRLLSVTEITQDLQETLDLLYSHFPAMQVVLTVSPVRHLKDTLELNSVSKSTLRLASHILQEQNTQVSYFPAHELLLDDLRDYRFYSSDLLHPSTMAEEYIWDKFAAAYLAEDFTQFLQVWQQVQRDLAHRPFSPESASHQKFLHQLLTKLQSISSQVDVQKEIASVKSQLI